MPFKTKNGQLPVSISSLLQQCCALLSRNVWINWGKKVKEAQGNRSPFFFIAVNFDKGSSVSSPPPFFFIWKGFVPSCIIPLHHGTAMKPAWYVCLKISGFHGNCFYLNNYSLCHLRHEKRRRRAQAQIPSQQQNIHEKAPRPSKPSPMKTCPPNRAETLQKPFLPPHSEHQSNCKPMRDAVHSLSSKQWGLGTKSIPLVGLCWSIFKVEIVSFLAAHRGNQSPLAPVSKAGAPQGCPLFPVYLLLCWERSL